MAHVLTVIENFAGYVKGEVISDVKKIEEILKSEWSAHVLKTAAPVPAVSPPKPE